MLWAALIGHRFCSFFSSCANTLRQSNALFISTAETDAEGLFFLHVVNLRLYTKCDGLKGVSKTEAGQRGGQDKLILSKPHM